MQCHESVCSSVGFRGSGSGLMELQGEDGSVVELAESVEKELGRGPGVAPHDRTVSRRQVRLRVRRIAAVKGRSRFRVSIEVVGPNPICVIHSNGGEGADEEVEIAKSGTQSLLEIGDKFSLSIQEPVFYTLQEPVARVGLGPHRSGESEPGRNGSSNSRESSGHDQSDGLEAGIAAADPDEEEGIAEAVARWQRRKQERLQVEQTRSTQEGGATGDRLRGRVEGEGKQAGDRISEPAFVSSEHDPPEADDLELTGGPRTDEDDTDLVKKFGFVVEGSEFERYGKKGLDTSIWDWRIGRRPANDSDEEEEEEEEGGGQVRHGQTGKQSRITAGSKANQKAKRANADDDDDWRGDSEGEKELLSTGKRPVSQKKDVQTRSHDLATTSGTISEPRKKRKLVSTAAHGPDVQSKSREQGKTRVNSRQATSSTKKSTKRKSRAKEKEEEEDDDGEDLDGFLVDDVEEEDEPEVADDEDEWTDEDEDEEEDEEVDEEDEIDEGRSKGTPQLAGNAPTPSRPVKDNELDRGGDQPLCKYGNKCFRKNKDHLAQFRH